MNKLRVGILGATGMVGRTYAHLLRDHPFFEVSFLAASEKSAGRSYAEVLEERELSSDSISAAILSLPIHRIDQIDLAGEQCSFVFSAVGTKVARIYEKQYAAAGIPVVSNASCHRMDPDVPLLIPEINPEHLGIIPYQQRNRNWNKGFIVVKPNCSLQSYLLPLYALHGQFGIKKLIVSTMQAVSGAGYPGVSSLDVLDNIVPHIGGEEEKSEKEPLKILGELGKEGIGIHKGIVISAHCNRVPVTDGHLACVSVLFEKKPRKEEVLTLWSEFRGLPQKRKLPSAPSRPLVYKEEANRPQPRLDRDAGGGMAVVLGRLRECSVFDFRFVALSHNVMRGAAKGGLLNAELLYDQGYLEKVQ